jgi:tartrate dehydratase alpha subunit/fumarate hydratase class I-like protein
MKGKEDEEQVKSETKAGESIPIGMLCSCWEQKNENVITDSSLNAITKENHFPLCRVLPPSPG